MNETDVLKLSAVDTAALIRGKKLSPVEAVGAVLRQIERIDPTLNAFCTVMADQAQQAAREAEGAVVRGDKLGPLHGVPASVKDNLTQKGARTTFGSKLFEHNIGTEDAPVVERLKQAGAILVGRTNTPEFGWKGVTDNRVFGITRNPWNPKLTPGGSSGGAAAAVASGMGPIGLGTDGGGSLRIPASFCGVVGLKASFGRVPNYPAGTAAILRHIGGITRTVADSALTLDVLAGPDERDLASLPRIDGDFLGSLDAGIKGVRIAWSRDLGHVQVDPEVAALCEKAALRFAEAGAKVEAPALKWPDPYDAWSVFFFGGMTAAFKEKLATQGDLIDPGLRRVIEQGLKLTAVDYINALSARDAFWQKTRRTFAEYDLLITPTMPMPPFAVGMDNAPGPAGDPMKPLQWCTLTYPFNLTGQPAISVPCGWTANKLPVGLQIIGRRFDDRLVLRAARAWEQLSPWSDARPPVAS